MYEFAVAPAVTSIRRRGVEIAEVAPESLGFDLELESGDRIIKVNGRPVRDYLDFRFQTAGETEITMEVRKSRARIGKSKSSAMKAKILVLVSNR